MEKQRRDEMNEEEPGQEGEGDAHENQEVSTSSFSKVFPTISKQKYLCQVKGERDCVDSKCYSCQRLKH